MENRNVLYVAILILGIGLWYAYTQKTGDGLSGIFQDKTPAAEEWMQNPGWDNQPSDNPPVNPSPTPPPETGPPPTPPEIRPPDRDDNRNNRPPFRPG